MRPPYALCCDGDWFTPDQKRIKDKTALDANGCWIWSGTLDYHGYGRLVVRTKGSKPKQRLAHRLSYAAFRGALVKGLVLDHLCRVPACVNPWHLDQVTHQVNILRGVGPAAVNAKKTYCDRGHPLSGENLKAQPGGRACRECARIADRASKWRKFINSTLGGAS